ncbi:hypothetical protein [Aestuariivivens insulae]|uniref:hypothetical protein n=1 Tax=Aestuariivivens insulae TaxID=1621988 RepID=UPI001F5604D3|nr:hypothetical protein [Aestuariivivens insulae]
MSKYRFKSSEKWAVWKTHGENCNWCNIPIYYPHCQIDHVLPESLPHKDIKTYNRLKKLYKLHSDFEINSFYNWIPIHSSCNQSKSDNVFDGAPFVGQLLKRIEKKFDETIKWHNSMKQNLKLSKAIATIVQAVEDRILKESDLNEIFKSVKDPAQAYSQIIISAFQYGLRRFDNDQIRKIKIKNIDDCASILKGYDLTQQMVKLNPYEKGKLNISLPGDFPDFEIKKDAQKIEWLNKIVNITDSDADQIR